MVDYKAQGKTNRRNGQKFELKVRKYLESEGYVVFKNHNQINIKKGFVQASPKFFRGRPVSLGTGFPDFFAFMPKQLTRRGIGTNYKIIFVEAKKGKYLDREEKEKCNWLLENGYEVWVAYEQKDTKRVLMLNYLMYGKR